MMERSHIALHKWLQAFHLMTSSKKGISAHQLHRTLDITYEAAWFITFKRRRDQPTGLCDEMGHAHKADRVRTADQSGDQGTQRVSACRDCAILEASEARIGGRS